MTKLINLRQLRSQTYKFIHTATQKHSEKDDNKNSRPVFTPNEEKFDSLEAPTTCCMSGCANCVWIQYAEKLSQTMLNSGPEIQKKIMENVQDPNMRAFLSMELRARKIIE